MVVLMLHPETIGESADALEETEGGGEVLFGFDTASAINEVATVATDGTGDEVEETEDGYTTYSDL